MSITPELLEQIFLPNVNNKTVPQAHKFKDDKVDLKLAFLRDSNFFMKLSSIGNNLQ